MSYSVNNLRNTLDEKITALGIDYKFKENPAYKTVLAEIDALISQMNMFEAGNTVQVYEKDKTLSFKWDKSYGERYSMEISVPSKDVIKCRKVENVIKLVANKEIHIKNVVERVSKIGNMGQLTITSNHGSANDFECPIGECNVKYGAEKKEYNPDGVMETRDNRSFKGYRLNSAVQYLDPEIILTGTRGAFGSFFEYYRRTFMVREKLDVARVIYEDKENNEFYFGKLALSQEHGLADMYLKNNGGEGFEKHVVIHPLMTTEIEKMLEKEDPKVAEGLRAYAVGREDYSYDSEDDKEYVYRVAK